MSKTCSQDFQLRVSDLIIKNKFLRVFRKSLCTITRTVKEKKNRKDALVSSLIGTAVLEVLQELQSKKTPQAKKKRSKINVNPRK